MVVVLFNQPTFPSNYCVISPCFIQFTHVTFIMMDLYNAKILMILNFYLMMNCLDWETLTFRIESKILFKLFHTLANLSVTQDPPDPKCFCASMSTALIIACLFKAPSARSFNINSIIVKISLMPNPL